MYRYLYDMSLKGLTPFRLSNIGAWWDKDREIDIVAYDKEENNILFCETRWQELNRSKAKRYWRN
ncbi:MAG: DUF234 domain-containing protein [Thermoproteota archaeon]